VLVEISIDTLEMRVYDSTRGGANVLTEVLPILEYAICKKYKCDKFSMIVMQAPQQRCGNDCGLHVLLCTEFVLTERREQLDFNADDAIAHRNVVLQEILGTSTIGRELLNKHVNNVISLRAEVHNLASQK